MVGRVQVGWMESHGHCHPQPYKQDKCWGVRFHPATLSEFLREYCSPIQLTYMSAGLSVCLNPRPKIVPDLTDPL